MTWTPGVERSCAGLPARGHHGYRTRAQVGEVLSVRRGLALAFGRGRQRCEICIARETPSPWFVLGVGAVVCEQFVQNLRHNNRLGFQVQSANPWLVSQKFTLAPSCCHYETVWPCLECLASPRRVFLPQDAARISEY